ncbi:MAG: hypothetical protein JNJ49_00335 [Bdellovibrionaceae bacterium]|nr:hypothetical protein [Pseudobdellovibrionaceae bacterium]
MKTLTLIFTVLFCITSVAQIHGPPTRYKTVSLKTVSDFFSQRPSPDAKKARLLAELLVSVFKQDAVSVAESTPLDKVGNFLEFKLTESSLLYAKGANGTLATTPLDEGQRQSLRKLLPEISKYAKGESHDFVFRHLQAWAMLEVGNAEDKAKARALYRSFMEFIVQNDGPARVGLPPNMVNFAMLGESLSAEEKKNYLARVEARLTEQRRLIREQEQFRKSKPQSP